MNQNSIQIQVFGAFCPARVVSLMKQARSLPSCLIQKRDHIAITSMVGYATVAVYKTATQL